MNVKSAFYDAAAKLHARKLPFIVHLILGLPGENRLDLLESIRAVNQVQPFGVKLQLLHILRGTDLALLYESGKLPVLTQEEYLDLLISCITALSPNICLHRITGDGPRKLLIAPQWSLAKRNVLNRLHALMKQRNLRQGKKSWIPFCRRFWSVVKKESKRLKNKIFQSRDLCLRTLDTNSTCAKNVRRNEDNYEPGTSYTL